MDIKDTKNTAEANKELNQGLQKHTTNVHTYTRGDSTNYVKHLNYYLVRIKT